MSGIRMNSEEKTQITVEERTKIQNLHTPSGIDSKLLLCLLEAIEDMREEISQLRQSNKEMAQTLASVVGQSHGTNVLNIHQMSKR